MRHAYIRALFARSHTDASRSLLLVDEARSGFHLAAGDAEQARRAWQRSLDLRTGTGLPIDAVLAKLQAESQ